MNWVDADKENKKKKFKLFCIKKLAITLPICQVMEVSREL